METIEATTTSESGYTSVSRVGEYELTIDAANEEGPTPNEVLVVDYVSCFVPAFRVGANKEGHDDLGRIDVDAEADIDDSDDLDAVRFSMNVEADLSDEEFDDIVERAENICHVHDALREGLHADVEVNGNAF
ncbi:OsmC family protein [Halocatena salina]|uniref:OsmC family protein n=1 Tax=Halocatena salina TaxID=2934340 RepID=A0A8U0A244_9EURY|nr:OsmC family protein [Halocatena salina]UPM43251.1 OsmC family protein [Halocatena salina]